MQDQNTRRGFTLIELLVVVLIIGILAAVAVPQYQKAVRKARLAEAKINLRALGNATEAYVLAHIYEPQSMQDLDITLPPSNAWTFDLYEFGGSDEGGYGATWRATPKHTHEKYEIYYSDRVYGNLHGGNYGGKLICVPTEDSGIKQCQEFGSVESDYMDDAIEID